MSGFYMVWRDDEDEAECARKYEAYDVHDAAQDAAAWDHSNRDGWEWSWPIVYKVRDVATDQLWAIEVDRETVPEFHAGREAPYPMPPAVHVLYSQRTMCEDIRLRSVPGSWPEGQTWISIDDAATKPEQLEKVTCAGCAKRTKWHIEARAAIGLPK